MTWDRYQLTLPNPSPRKAEFPSLSLPSFRFILSVLDQAEQRRCEEEQQKRQENEMAFRAWLLRKRGQVQEERRIHQAQEMERMNGRVWPQRGDTNTPNTGFCPTQTVSGNDDVSHSIIK